MQNTRRSELEKQLWITGCSITAGKGVDSGDRYCVSIANNLFNGQFVDLSRNATSLDWQADQLLRSDIRPDDVVIWGLTSEYRAVMWDRETQDTYFLNAYKFDHKKTSAADDVCDETRLYKAIISCHQVANYCQRIGAHLFMFPMIASEKLRLALHDHKNFFHLPYQCSFIDFGTDELHPGVLQHQWYAEQISKVLVQQLQF